MGWGGVYRGIKYRQFNRGSYRPSTYGFTRNSRTIVEFRLFIYCRSKHEAFYGWVTLNSGFRLRVEDNVKKPTLAKIVEIRNYPDVYYGVRYSAFRESDYRNPTITCGAVVFLTRRVLCAEILFRTRTLNADRSIFVST